jgi:hypothetical protein
MFGVREHFVRPETRPGAHVKYLFAVAGVFRYVLEHRLSFKTSEVIVAGAVVPVGV